MTNFPRDLGLMRTIEDLQRRLYTLERRVADNLPSFDYGSVVVNLAAANTGSTNIVFAQNFVSSPRVYVSMITSNNNMFAKVDNTVTANGCTIVVAHRDAASTITASPTVNWIALGD